MKPASKTVNNPATMNSMSTGIKQVLTKPQYNKVDSPNPTGQLGQPTLLTNNLVSPGPLPGLPAQTMTTAVTANPHHFQPAPVSQTAYQNGVGGATDGHVMMPKSHDPQVKEQQEQTLQPNLANTKEKTPMCLINELARFNKISHQYTLVDEQGPAHKKNFFVKLQLGEKEEYSASGPSIKKAQHAAAGIALEKTECKHPPPKVKRNYPGLFQIDLTNDLEDGSGTITPTVELNTLAMKRGEPAVYKNLENRNPHPIYYQHNYDFRGMYNQRYHFMKPPRVYYVSLKVGSREFIGDGNSRQAARHNAATKALEILRNLPMPDSKPMKTDSKEDGKDGEKNEDKEENEETKSEISIVHELALRLNMPVSFEVTRESGPPHMKNFVTQCTVGTLQTEAEGNSKKLSKRRAAELMLAELKKLPQLPALTLKPKTKPAANKKKNRNLIKQMQKGDPTYGVGINPISRLIQIQQAQKKKEPVYTLLAERGLPRRREFVMQVMVDDETCTGVGPNKKLAKRHAAEAMLLHLGYNKPSPQPAKPAIKTATESTNGEKKVHFVENSDESGPSAGGAGNRQMVPGLLVLPEGNRANMNSFTQMKGFAGMSNQYGGGATLLNATGFGMRPELKLREVAARYNIEVKFDEFAGKNNTNEYLSRVVVASNPQHTLHGSGPTPEASRDAASLTALKILTEMGVIKEEKMMPGGDGPHMKTTVG